MIDNISRQAGLRKCSPTLAEDQGGCIDDDPCVKQLRKEGNNSDNHHTKAVLDVMISLCALQKCLTGDDFAN